MTTIRTAEPHDLDAIMELERASFGQTAWSRESMQHEMSSEWGRYIVADDAGVVVGYAGLRAVGVEGDIQTICVAADRQGSGIGRGLLAELEHDARMRGVRELFLEVREDNPSARHLYGSVGFEAIGERPGYYQPENVTAVVMRKVLR